MNMKKSFLILNVLILFLVSTVSVAFALPEGGDKSKRMNKTSDKKGDAYRMFINNINLPLNREGVIADVSLNNRSGGELDGKIFLFSSGFFLSGITNGTMWANAVASASRIQDYVPGTVKYGKNDSRNAVYVLSVNDVPFGKSWQDWKDAVALGAEFYDGDGDGIYNPVDINSNGTWERFEDRPDLIGDETVWCVYTDGTDPALRRFNDVDPQGIEIRQTVFGFGTKAVTGNMLFVRYQILNTGSVADVLDSCYFGVWADPDLGDPNDDLVGCDVSLNAGFVYNDGDDPTYGPQPPAFIIDFFQGPVAYIPGVSFTDVNSNGKYDEGDIALDTAFNVRGQVRGVEKFVGATNLGLSSFVHYQQSDNFLGDPNNRTEARNYMLGTARLGDTLNPCTWTLGSVQGGVDCNTVNSKFWYSGDPVTKVGWINNTPTDQRQMSNTGPFQLVKGQPITIIAAYVVGRGENALNSVTLAKQYDKVAQILFDNNFPSPPPPPPIEYTTTTGSDFIDLTWKTSKSIKYIAIDTVQDINRRVEGFYVTQYLTKNKVTTVDGVKSAVVIANYDLKDSINNIYVKLPNGGIDLKMSEGSASNKMDSAFFADPTTGRINLRINTDAFTGGPLIKGKEYYFEITQYTLNHNVIVNKGTNTYGPSGDYYDPTNSAVAEDPTKEMITVVMNEDMYSPAVRSQETEKVAGSSDGAVKYIIVDGQSLTGNDYQVEFFKNTNPPANSSYLPFWKLKNVSTGTTLIDSSVIYNFDTSSYAGKTTEGFIVKVKSLTPEIGTLQNSGTTWYDPLSTVNGFGAFYVGTDIPQGTGVPLSPTARSKTISADQLRRIEIRFSNTNTGKAYRYLNGFKGNTIIQQRASFLYAGGIGKTDTSTAKGTPTPWDAVKDRAVGYVDVPFTAWLVDSKYPSETKQLAVGFIEKSKNIGGVADGNWDPKDSLALTGEYLVVFNAPYDVNGGQLEYTGSDAVGYADIIKGWTPTDTTVLSSEKRKIASSPWFNAMYVLGLQRKDLTSFYKAGDTLKVPVTTYPYTNADKFTFKTKYKAELTTEEKKDLFNKVNVYPNPLFAYNPATSFNDGNPDEPFVTFTNLPEQVTVKIFTLSGTLVRTLNQSNKSYPTSPYLQWDLENEDGLRVASGMFLAIVDAPGYGEKVLKFAIIMPQKQIQQY